MRLRDGVTCATMTCVGAALAIGGLASCVGDDNAAPAVDASINDATQPDSNVPQSEDAGTDTGTDATDAAPQVDANPGVDAADANPGCVPTGLAFAPKAYVPAHAQTFDCSNDSQDLALAQACIGDASTLDACVNFAAQNAAEDGGVPATCSACLLTPEGNDAGTYGPAIVGSITVPNLAGCIELADPTDAGVGCAMAIQRAWECAEVQCNPNCAVTDEPSHAAFVACTATAATNSVCNSYTVAANACLATEAVDGGPFAVTAFCVGAGDPVTQFEDIARFFCTS